MSTLIHTIYKIKKRIIFELEKKIKKIKHLTLRQYILNEENGCYKEINLIDSSLSDLYLYYKKSNLLEHEIKDADRIISGDLNLSYFNNQIKIDDWNKDYESNYVYPIKYYGDIKYINFDDKTDVKNVWELSRLHHLVIISKAYALSSNVIYYDYIKKQINSWVDNNPIGRSVNWTCNMEVSIRVVNLILCYTLISKFLENDNDFKKKLKALIYYHNKHIFENLENYSEKRNNHYLSNLMGLLISSRFLENKDSKRYKRYQKFARLEMESEIDKQIYCDGVTYEISTNYQKVVFEIILISFVLGESKDNKFEDKYKHTLKKMYVFLNNIKYKDGTFPLIGDNDNGNIIVFNNYFNKNRTNLNTILGLCKTYLSNSIPPENSLSIFLKPKKINHLKIDEKKNIYKDSGYYIMDNKRIKMIILCGPLSMLGQGGHSHNDQLSFILDIDELPIFIDPGTITYTGNSKLRNHSRATHSHNTVQIDHDEQNLFGVDLFEMSEQTYSSCEFFNNSEFTGIHKGYYEKYNCYHRRNVKLLDTSIIITDYLVNDNDDVMFDLFGKINLIMAKSVEIINNNGIVMFRSSGVLLYTNMNYNQALFEDIKVSSRYGHYYHTKKITYEFIGKNKLELNIA